MKLTLNITASAAVLAQILAALPEDAEVTTGNAASTFTGIGTPVAPASPPSLPNSGAATPIAAIPPMSLASTEDDDSGPANASAPNVDSNGLPWDERIHASTKNTNADGSWKKRRGVDAATVAQVEAELRGASGAPAAVSAPVAMPVGIPMQLSPPPAVAQPAIAPIPQPIPVDNPTPAPIPQPIPAPVPVAAPISSGPLDFLGLMNHLGPKMQERDAAGVPLINADYLANVTAEVSNAFIQAGHIQQPLAAITDMQGNQQMIDYTVQILRRDGRW